MKKALYFGSFNPLHIGHMAIANYVTEFCDADVVYFIPTPVNPLKSQDSSLEETYTERLESLRKAVRKSGLKITVSEIESHLQPPYYTINTLEALSSAEPESEFIVVIGADNLEQLCKWHRYGDILKNYEIWVFPRTGHNIEKILERYAGCETKCIRTINAPIVEISSTMIREAEAAGKNMNGFRYF